MDAPLTAAATGSSPHSAEPVLFEAQLTPHRSLPPQAFCVLMGLVIAVAFAAGVVTILLGAWPVMGFCGVELLLFYLLFRLNYRSAAGVGEWIRLTPARLEVVRWSKGREVGRWQLQPYWLSLALEGAEDAPGALLLRSHGRSLAIGRFLAPEERIRLKEALAEALQLAREPGAGATPAWTASSGPFGGDQAG